MMSNVYNRHIIPTKSRGFFQTPQKIIMNAMDVDSQSTPPAFVNATNNDFEV